MWACSDKLDQDLILQQEPGLFSLALGPTCHPGQQTGNISKAYSPHPDNGSSQGLSLAQGGRPKA